MKSEKQKREGIDLHLHTTLSDGKNTPEEVIRLAYEQGFRLIALSDHNTFAITQKIRIGEGEALMEVIPACEFSCSYYVPSMKENREIHVVGLFPGADGVDLEDFRELFAPIQEGKLLYIAAILKQLEELGIHVTMQEVMETQRKSSFIGRHQVADVMIQKGYVDTWEQAFDNYIGNFSPYYVPATRYVNYGEFRKVIQTILDCYGFPILAHPFGYGITKEEIEKLIRDFAQIVQGRGGLEVYYEIYLNQPEKMTFLKEMQEKYQLLPSASSDRHCTDEPFASGGTYPLYQAMLGRCHLFRK